MQYDHEYPDEANGITHVSVISRDDLIQNMIHAWNKVRIDDYLKVESLMSLVGDHPKYLGWVPINRILKQREGCLF